MNHAITIGGLLLSIGMIGRLLALLFGLLLIFAGGMSDDPGAGDSTANSGCITLVVGLVVTACFAGFVL